MNITLTSLKKESKLYAAWTPILFYLTSIAAAIVIIQTSYSQYDAGESDHLVVSPAGLLRADSSLYLNDYFVRNAKMPHWAFEFFTAFASNVGQVGLFYFVYWLIAVLFAAYGNLLVARKVISKMAYPLAIILFCTQLFGVRIMFGTSSVILNQALPHGLAASIAFVILAGLLHKRNWLTFTLVALIPIIHIQIGTIVVGLVVLYLILERIRGIQVHFFEVLAIFFSFLGMVFGFVYRPVAGNVKDFSRLCKDLAPHHCYAPSWSSEVIQGCLLIAALAILGGVVIKKSLIPLTLRLNIFLLPTLALLVALVIDRYEISLLADLVRGNNIYRIAVIVIPWLYWLPILLFRSERSHRTRTLLVLVSLVLVVRLMTIPAHGNYFENEYVPVVVLLALGFLVIFIGNWTDEKLQKWKATLVAVLLAMIPIFGLTQLGYRDFAMPRIGFLADPYFRSFGQALRDDLTVGQVIVGDPALSWIRVASGMAYGVDCKFRPLGGGLPLTEYYQRINPLGGYEAACEQSSFSTVDVNSLIDYSEKSKGDVLLLTSDDARIQQLADLGWKKLPGKKIEALGYVLLSNHPD